MRSIALQRRLEKTDVQVIEVSFNPYENNVEHFLVNDASSELDIAYEICVMAFIQCMFFPLKRRIIGFKNAR